MIFLLIPQLTYCHVNSTANVLKIAEHCEESETCQILSILDDFIRNSKNISPNSAQPAFGDQILALALGFAGRALKKFPNCASIFNFIYEWQKLVTFPSLESQGKFLQPISTVFIVHINLMGKPFVMYQVESWILYTRSDRNGTI